MLQKLKNRLSRDTKARLCRMLYSINIPRDMLYCLFAGVRRGSGLQLHGLPKIQQKHRHSIRMGKDCKLVSHWRKNSIGIQQAVILKTLRPESRIELGDRVGISGSTLSAATSIQIGNDVLIGSGCLLTDSDAHGLHPDDRDDPSKIVTRPIVVEDRVFIGARSIILKGVTLGFGSVIGAGSVVTSNVPAMTLVAGNPAKVIRTFPRGPSA